MSYKILTSLFILLGIVLVGSAYFYSMKESYLINQAITTTSYEQVSTESTTSAQTSAQQKSVANDDTLTFQVPVGWRHSATGISDTYDACEVRLGERNCNDLAVPAEVAVVYPYKLPDYTYSPKDIDRETADYPMTESNYVKQNISIDGATGYKVTYDQTLSGNGVSETDHYTNYYLVKDNKEYDVETYYVEGSGNAYIPALNNFYTSLAFN